MKKVEVQQIFELRFLLSKEELDNFKVILVTFKNLAEKTDIVTKFPKAVLVADMMLHSLE